MSLIRFASVSHRYEQRSALTEVTVTMGEQRIGVIGANGSGKSTFARMINGLVTPTSGRVSVDGMDVAKEGAAVRRAVSFLFSDPDAQIVMPTVAEDIAFSLRRRRLSREQVAARVAEVLALIGLEGYADHPAHALSSGQKQLLAMAAVLVTEPKVLVCDEPTTLLDLRNTRRLVELIAGLPQQVIVVTHDLDIAAGLERVLVFDAGRLVADCPGPEAVDRYRTLHR